MEKVILHLIVPGEYGDGELVAYAFELSEGPAARLAGRGVSLLSVRASRCTEARKQALERQAAFEEHQKTLALSGGKRKKGDPTKPAEIPQLYEDADVQALLDEVATWHEAQEEGTLPPLPADQALGTFASDANVLRGPTISAEAGARVLTAVYMAAS
jgi:hypothetical protein